MFGPSFKYEDIFGVSQAETSADIENNRAILDPLKINEINIDSVNPYEFVILREESPKSQIPIFRSEHIDDARFVRTQSEEDEISGKDDEIKRTKSETVFFPTKELQDGKIEKRNSPGRRRGKRVKVRVPANKRREGRQNGYLAPPPAPDTGYGSPAADLPSYAAGPAGAPASQPVAILKMTGLDNKAGPIPRFNFMYKTANDINAMAEGELRNICDEDVSVMTGSYDYKGPDGKTYKVDWYADETGFHPTGAHFPQPVQPDHPEVAAAVKAQIAFARQQGGGGAMPGMPCPPKTPAPPLVEIVDARADTGYGAPPADTDLPAYTPDLSVYTPDLPSYQ